MPIKNRHNSVHHNYDQCSENQGQLCDIVAENQYIARPPSPPPLPLHSCQFVILIIIYIEMTTYLKVKYI